MKKSISLLGAVVCLCLVVCALSGRASAAVTMESGQCGENLTWTLDDTGTLTISGTGEMLNYNRNTMPWKGHLESITSVVIEEGATSIGNYAFSGCSNLTSVDIGNGVTSIGSSAFAYCSRLVQ